MQPSEAEHAARRTAEAARLVASTTRQESTNADAALVASRSAEDVARDHFLDAQKQGFPKEEDA